MPALPAFIAPMLAKPGEPFDSDDYLFEIKWDGVRALCFVENGVHRLVNRQDTSMTDRYPELAFLAELPAGTVLDGELVVLKDGKPDFALIQSRHHARSALKVRMLARMQPATFIAFDLLYDAGESIMNLPLVERRLRLEQRIGPFVSPGLVISKTVHGKGKKFFRETMQNGLEGIVAKHLASKYQPGQRSDAWIKIKGSIELVCVVIGFIVSPTNPKQFRSLILATDQNGELGFCGKVGTGWSLDLQTRINDWLWSHLRNKPIVKCDLKGKWVEPAIIMRVSSMERTANGELREPVFEELIGGM